MNIPEPQSCEGGGAGLSTGLLANVPDNSDTVEGNPGHGVFTLGQSERVPTSPSICVVEDKVISNKHLFWLFPFTADTLLFKACVLA